MNRKSYKKLLNSAAILLTIVLPISSGAQHKKLERTMIDFRGGVSRNRRPLQNQAYKIKNARPKSDGTLVVRDGQSAYALVGDPTVGSIQLLDSYYSDTYGLLVYAVKREDGVNDKPYLNDTLLTGVDFGAGDYTTSTQYKDVKFFANGGVIKYHAPTTSTPTWGDSLQWGTDIAWNYEGIGFGVAEITGTPTPPTGDILAVYKDRMYVADSTTGTLYWSNAGVFTTLPECDFPALNFIDIGSVGNGITGVVVGQDFLVAFTREGYDIMTGVPDDDGGLGDMYWQHFGGAGISQPKAAIVADRKVFFVGTNRRIYMLSGYTLTDLDPYNDIQEYMNAMDRSAFDAVSVAWNGDELWIYAPKKDDITDGRILIFNPALASWTTFENINGYAFEKEIETNRFFVGSADGGVIWEQVGQQDKTLRTWGDTVQWDAGFSWASYKDSGIDFELKTRHESLGILRHKKIYRICSVMANAYPSETWTVKYAKDNDNDFTSFDSASTFSITGYTWGDSILWGDSYDWGWQDTQGITFSRSTDIRARELQLQITGSVTGGSSLLGYSIEGEEILLDSP